MTYSFTKEDLYKFAPMARGVYFLFDGPEMIYIGRAAGDSVTIYSRLASHQRGDEGRCTACATHFGFEVTEYPYSREAELQEEYKRITGRLPRCNERVG